MKTSLSRESGNLKPSEFMRARRPELFADSRCFDEPTFSKETLGYALDTLTARKDEIRFEHFCRRLAEKEICPNLLPQTGPTGGGDSKVDAETYPVADSIQLRWYEGVGREAASERWAFAFSAKKDWRTKVKADIAQIAQTKRGYRHAYFITSQFVRDKVRAQLEDELSKKWKLHVHILDRTWIIERVFESRLFELARDSLGLTESDISKRTVVGPNDARRIADLEELDALIDDQDRYRDAEYQLAEDCLETALLARGLGRPRTEIEGRFQRAERVARRLGLRQQQLRFVYLRAWTAYWWFDDFDELNVLYDAVEALAIGTTQAWHLELLVNLWLLVKATVTHGNRDAQTMKFEARTATLQSELAGLSTDKKRPTNSYWAQTQMALMDLALFIRDPKRGPELLTRFEQILKGAESLPDYPMDTLIRVVRDLGQFIGEHEGYDGLIELILNVAGDRSSRSEQGSLLVDRGYQKLRVGKVYDAIRLFGRAQMLLALKEHREKFLRTLVGTASGYEAAGLLWAARATLVIAANQLLNDFAEKGLLSRSLIPVLKKLVWIELQIGRVPCVLGWMELLRAVVCALSVEKEAWKAFEEEYELMDAVLSILVLNTEYQELRNLDSTPSLLAHFDLFRSRVASLYALGHEEIVRQEAGVGEENLQQLFLKLIDQPAKADLPKVTQWLSFAHVEFRTFVLGCEVTLRVRNQVESILIADSILGILEAFLATSLDRRLLPYRPNLRCELLPSEYITTALEVRIDEDEYGDPIFNILHQPRSVLWLVQHESFRETIFDLVIKMVAHIAIPKDDKVLEDLAASERVFDRAFSLTDLAIAATNIFGEIPKVRLNDWLDRSGKERFPLLRQLPWWHSAPIRDQAASKPSRKLKWGEGVPPEELFGVDSMKHTDQKVVTVINMPLWNRAGWRGVLFAVPPAPDIPTFALLFTERDAAEKIFRGWRKQAGDIDHKEAIRITVLTGIDHDHPQYYRVQIAQNPDLIANDDKRILVMLSRTNTMTPKDSQNWDRFFDAYQKAGRFLLAPALMSRAEEPEIGFGLAIQKREINVIPAWQVGENSPEMMALQKEDKPIIPDNTPNPPVQRALERIMKRDKT